MINDRCAFPGCERFPWQVHHVLYASDDKRHSECRLDGCKFKHCQDAHPEWTETLCLEHHQMITMINTHVWLHKRRHVLTCAERRYWWSRFLGGYTVKPLKYDERTLKMGDILDSEKRSDKW